MTNVTCGLTAKKSGSALCSTLIRWSIELVFVVLIHVRLFHSVSKITTECQVRDIVCERIIDLCCAQLTDRADVVAIGALRNFLGSCYFGITN